MAKGQQKATRETKKPKKAPEQKAAKPVSAYKQSLGKN